MEGRRTGGRRAHRIAEDAATAAMHESDETITDEWVIKERAEGGVAAAAAGGRHGTLSFLPSFLPPSLQMASSSSSSSSFSSMLRKQNTTTLFRVLSLHASPPPFPFIPECGATNSFRRACTSGAAEAEREGEARIWCLLIPPCEADFLLA